MDQFPPTSTASTSALPGAVVQAIIDHLCQDPCHAYGAVLEWCESRGDCVSAVICPSCNTQFVVDDDELAELQRWTDTEGHTLVCGIRLD